MKKIILIGTVFVLPLMLVACQSNSGDAELLTSQNWQLVAMPGYTSFPNAVTLHFDPSTNTVSGSGGCNSFSGGYEVKGDSLKLTGPMMTTLMACMDDDVTKIESDYLRMLGSMSTYKIDGGEFVLMTDEGELVFEAVNK